MRKFKPILLNLVAGVFLIGLTGCQTTDWIASGVE